MEIGNRNLYIRGQYTDENNNEKLSIKVKMIKKKKKNNNTQ